MNEIDFPNLVDLVRGAKSPDPGAGPLLVDCRAREYWLWETIEGSVNLRWKEVTERASQVLPDKQRLIVTFCQSALCPASSKAYESLRKLGYSNLVEYPGGLEDWRAKGGAVVSSREHRLGADSFRFPDQEFYGERVGCYLVEDDDRVVLVDGPQVLTDANEDFILSFGKPMSVFMTHGSTGGAAETLRSAHGAEVILHRSDLTNEWLRVTPTRLFDQSFNLSANLRVLHTPGHSPGSACLFDRRSGFLFSGDHLQGSSPRKVYDFRGDFGEGRDPSKQLESLRGMSLDDLRAVYPFHSVPLTSNPGDAIRAFLERAFAGIM